MTTKKQLLMELISGSASDGKSDVTTWLALQLAKDFSQLQAVEQEKRPQLFQSSIALPASAREVHNAVRDYLRNNEVGALVTFIDISYHIEHYSGINLDHYQNKNRERWRQQVSSSISDFVRLEILAKQPTKGHYRINRRP